MFAPSDRLQVLLRRALALLLALAGSLSATAWAAEKFLEPEQAFRLEVGKAADDALRLTWTIAPGYYLYRDRIAVSASPGGAPLQGQLPRGIVKDDPNFGVTEIYHDGVTMTLAAAGASALDVTWQGCAEAGLCYPPQTRRVELAGLAPVGGATAPPAATQPVATPPPAANPPPAAAGSGAWAGLANSESRITQWLGDGAFGWALPLFFVLGIALAFTPCVLPMLPIVSGVVVGSQATPRRAFALSLVFVLPMALTYAALGVAAALAGANLQAALQNRWTALAIGAVYIVLALGMFGFFNLQLPAWLRERLDRAGQGRRGGTLPGAAALGTLSALLVGPCMTAPLAGVLLYIAQSGNAVQGAALLLALGLGKGAPLVVAGTLGARLLPRPGAWMERVKAALGFVLLGTAVWMFERAVSAPVAVLLWGALLIAIALTLAHAASRRSAAAAPAPSSSGPRLAARTLALVVGLWGGAMVLGAAGGAGDPWRPLAWAAVLPQASAAPAKELRFEAVSSGPELQARLAAAQAAGQPTVVDFYADWCVSCKTIEKTVFGDPRVQHALAGALLLRADITANDAGHQALMRRHEVVGPPTVMLFDAQGRERREARLVGEFGADKFLLSYAALQR